MKHKILIAAAAMWMIWPSVAGAQQLPPLTPIPPPHGHSILAQTRRADLAAQTGSPWQALTNQPTFLVNGACNPLQLTDGTVMVQDCGSQNWWRLTPDDTGNYVNGTWTQLASLPAGYSPLYHSSAVLPDGRVIIEGGEYNFFHDVETNLGAIYDPVANTWTSVPPPAGLARIGDAQSVVLANGTYMQANCCTTEADLLDPKTLAWTPTGAGKSDVYSEEMWTLLPNQRVLTVDTYVFQYNAPGMNSEIYNPSTGRWQSAGSTRLQLWDSAADCGGQTVSSFEVGPGVLRPDGTVFYTGANSCGAAHTAIYNSFTGKWTAGPDFPNGVDIADGPAALEPNGKVLMMASPGIYQTPATFLEWDGKNLTQIPGTPNAPSDSSYYGNMLVLPTGQILLTDFSNDVEIFTPAASPKPNGRPLVLFTPLLLSPGDSYQVFGIGLNGVSQGAAYGDDVQAATNYPLVRITNLKTGHVFYSRTHDHSSMAVASAAIVSTHYDVPDGQEPGLSELVVVANGISSNPVFLYVQ